MTTSRAAPVVPIRTSGGKLVGTGFVLWREAGRVLVVTAAHVISAADGTKLPGVRVRKQPPAAQCIGERDGRDLAVLLFTDLTGQDQLQPLRAGRAVDGAKVDVFGCFSFDDDNPIQSHKVAARLSTGSSRFDNDDQEMQTWTLTTLGGTERLEKGNSGGPVVDENGCVVGVVIIRKDDAGAAGAALDIAELEPIWDDKLLGVSWTQVYSPSAPTPPPPVTPPFPGVPEVSEMDTMRGLKALRDGLQVQQPTLLPDLDTLEERMRDNKREQAFYGSTETLRNDYYKIIRTLNDLAMRYCGQSFNDLCRLPPPPPPPPPNGRSRSASTPDQLLRAADRAYNLEDWTAAIPLYEQYLQARPTDQSAQQRYTEALRQKGLADRYAALAPLRECDEYQNVLEEIQVLRREGYTADPQGHQLWAEQHQYTPEQIAPGQIYTLLSAASQLFGTTVHAGLLTLSDAEPKPEPVDPQPRSYVANAQPARVDPQRRSHVAIDRLTGGVGEGPFIEELVPAAVPLECRLRLSNFALWHLALLALTIQEFNAGYSAIGGGTRKGQGQVRIAVSGLACLYSQVAGPLTGGIVSAQARLAKLDTTADLPAAVRAVECNRVLLPDLAPTPARNWRDAGMIRVEVPDGRLDELFKAAVREVWVPWVETLVREGGA